MPNKSISVSQDREVQNEVSDKRQVPARDPEEMLGCIMKSLAETVLEASDEELLAESREEGRDPLEEAEEVRQTLLDAVKAVTPQAWRRR